jgi:dihydrolipoamide dehydrogenase
VGREPNTDGLGLSQAGVEVDSKGFIKVNECLESSTPGIYAAGDVTGLPYLAHRAMAQGYYAAENACSSEGSRPHAALPSVVYSDPEIAVVGMDERACSARGLEFLTGIYSFGSSGRAQTLGRMEGFVKVLGEKGSRRLLGVSMVGSSVSELIGECSAMINASLTLDDIASSAFPHPSLSEAIMEAARVALGDAEKSSRN